MPDYPLSPQLSDNPDAAVAVNDLNERVQELENAPPPVVNLTGNINADGDIHATGQVTADGNIISQGGISGTALSGGDCILSGNLFLWAQVAPPDEQIGVGQVAIHYDQYTGKVYLRGRLSNGNLFSKVLATEA